MNYKALCCLLLMWLPMLSSPVLAGDAKAARLEALVSQWVGLERQADTLKVNWETQERLMRQRIELLNLQKKSLQARLSDKVKEQSKVQEVRATLLAEQSQLEQRQQQMEDSLERFDSELKGIAGRLPPPLQNQWQRLLASLTASDSSSEKLDVYLEMLNAVEQFEKQLSQHREVFEIQGKQVLVHQVYLGVARGWYASADGHAGIGKPVGDTWEWQAEPELFEQVQALLSAIKKPEHVELMPLEVADIKREL